MKLPFQLTDQVRLQRLIAEGGGAKVYLGTLLDQPVAVKVPALNNDLQHESQVFQSLTAPHPNLLSCLLSHEEPEFLVLELGESPLSDQENALPAVEVLAIGRALAQGLNHLHQQGWVHADVKPSNLLRVDATLKLADFGTACRMGGRQGRVAGSVPFMAPEQIQGGVHTAATDQFGLACTLFTLLTGETPLDLGTSPLSSPRWTVLAPPARPVVAQALSSDASARFTSIDEFVIAFERALEQAADWTRQQPAQRGAGWVATLPATAPAAIERVLAADSTREPPAWAQPYRPRYASLWVVAGMLLTLIAVFIAGPPRWAHYQMQVAQQVNSRRGAHVGLRTGMVGDEPASLSISEQGRNVHAVLRLLHAGEDLKRHFVGRRQLLSFTDKRGRELVLQVKGERLVGVYRDVGGQEYPVDFPREPNEDTQ